MPASRSDLGTALRTKSGRPGRLEGLKCWPAVLKRIRDGVPLVDIARFIQDDQHEYTEVKPISVVRGLQRWIDGAKILRPSQMVGEDAPPMEILVDSDRLLKRSYDWQRELEADLDRSFDALHEMAFLIVTQRMRVERAVNLEREAGIPFPSINREVQLLGVLLKDYLTILADFGIVERAPHKFQAMVLGVNVGQGMPLQQNLLEGLNEGQLKLLLELEHMLMEPGRE